MSDCLVVGGGVIGLSLAYELAEHGLRVRLIDASRPGQEASWAGAGILPPAVATPDPLEQLTALSNDLHRQWSDRLRAETGIDNGYRTCGAIYLARTAEEAQQLAGFADAALARKIAVRRVDITDLGRLEPALQPRGQFHAAYDVPGECQIRNPRHVKALVAGCLNRGVEITPGAAAEDFEIRGSRVRAVRTSVGLISAGTICLTAGAWSSVLAARLNLKLAVRPIRGQIVLLSTCRPVLKRIVNEGRSYLVPRADGRLLVGSTEEDAGFDKTTKAGATSNLLQFALSLVPDLEAAQVERSWAGLRPGTADGKPYLGRAADLENMFVAAGHFRSGLQLSTGTAVVMSQLVRGEQPQVPLASFSPNRDSVSPKSAGASAKRPRAEAPAR